MQSSGMRHITITPRLGHTDRLAKHQLGERLPGSRAEGLPFFGRINLRQTHTHRKRPAIPPWLGIGVGCR